MRARDPLPARVRRGIMSWPAASVMAAGTRLRPRPGPGHRDVRTRDYRDQTDSGARLVTRTTTTQAGTMPCRSLRLSWPGIRPAGSVCSEVTVTVTVTVNVTVHMPLLGFFKVSLLCGPAITQAPEVLNNNEGYPH